MVYFRSILLSQIFAWPDLERAGILLPGQTLRNIVGTSDFFKLDPTPNTPKDRVEILRKAFTDTMKDPEFLADAKRANLDINPGDGATLEQNVKEILKLEPALVARLKEILK